MVEGGGSEWEGGRKGIRGADVMEKRPHNVGAAI